MKNIISLTFISSLLLIVSCEKVPVYEIPTNENGKVIITGVSSATSAGVSSLDDNFTVVATLPNAKSGDQMTVELLQLQTPQGGTTKQLLPMAGTQKTVTVGADLKASVTYTRTDAKLVNVGDYVTVTFAGKTDFAKYKVSMVAASTVSKPKVSGKEVDVCRTTDSAYFNVKVVPIIAAYTGDIIVKRKNGTNNTWVNVGATGIFSVPQPYLVPISGNDFAVGKDTMFYSFKATSGSYTDEITAKIVVRDPYFFLKKTATLILGGSAAGMNILTNTSVQATDANAIIAVDGGSLLIHGGSAWAVGGKSISFVESTLILYDKNSSTDAITAFEGGSPVSQADAILGTGVYIFKVINGPLLKDIYYGMIKVTSVTPGISVTIEYRIGNIYAHLAVIQ